jgi:hypothetical protein
MANYIEWLWPHSARPSNCATSQGMKAELFGFWDGHEDGFLDHHRGTAGDLGATIWLGYEGWTMDQDVQVSGHGYTAMALGILFLLVIGIGLMTLVFYSSRAGYDEPPRQIRKQRNPSDE